MAPTTEPMQDLLDYLQSAREALVWKAEALDDYDARRPLTPAGTNLLGLVKHLTGVELLYFGWVLGREVPNPPSWLAQDAELFADRWAGQDETHEEIIDGYRRAWTLTDTAVRESTPDTTGLAPWLPEPNISLGRILIHVLSETERHAGHADIIRELVDGSVGRSEGDDQLDNTGQGRAPADDAGWRVYRDQVEAAAQQARR